MIRQLFLVVLVLTALAQTAHSETECQELSKAAMKASKKGYDYFNPRCDSNGDYEKAQCIGSYCFCVDPKTGMQTGEAKKGGKCD
ncbi:hypothetical protein HNY73_019221 [Argiope bruennichi]|uniref:Thyroglobulin type-1 domain-containing protein n=1 Tax=Argiope bruennichi TaxID=94029 RepID=A0A8T0EFF8_ARGBR|nr:hypothetical protein HNY73_019221 [Argiope bruennichi]